MVFNHKKGVKMNKDIIYVAIVLDENSIQTCRTLFKHYSKMPIEEQWTVNQFTVSCDHITLAFGDDVTDNVVNCIGRQVTDIQPQSLLVDDYGCYGLFIPRKEFLIREIPFMGKYAHVTLGHPKVIVPREVGMIPERNHYCIRVQNLSLSGKIMSFCMDGKWH